MQEALEQCLPEFLASYQGTVCTVCGTEKWAGSAFCRGCSILLQRAHLMQYLMWVWDRYGHEAKTWELSVLENYFRHWDLCRDFLIDHRRTGYPVGSRVRKED
jgi:hypothetical protein